MDRGTLYTARWICGLLLCVILTAAFCGEALATEALRGDVEGVWDEPPTQPESEQAIGEDEPTDEPGSQPAAERGRRGGGRGEGRTAGRGSGRSSSRGQYGGARRGGRGRSGGFHIMDRILPMISEGHPDLAARLEKLREESPEQFERVVADALAIRFEEALARGGGSSRGKGRSEGEGARGGPPRPPEIWDSPGRGPEGPPPDDKLTALHRRDEELGEKTAELVERYLKLSDATSDEASERRARLERNIRKQVSEHFEVRTELRLEELKQLGGELGRLRQMMERIEQDLRRREASREEIIDRRVISLTQPVEE